MSASGELLETVKAENEHVSHHFSVRVRTLIYFAPNIINFQRIVNELTTGKDVQKNALQWKQLNYIRAGIFFAVSAGLLPLCCRLLSFKG